MEQLGHNTQVATKIAFCALRDTFSALKLVVSKKHAISVYERTQAIKTHLGRDELGSLTLTKPNCMRPSENSSRRSTSSPSVEC